MLEVWNSDLGLAMSALTVCFGLAGLLLAWFLLRAPGCGNSSGSCLPMLPC